MVIRIIYKVHPACCLEPHSTSPTAKNALVYTARAPRGRNCCPVFWQRRRLVAFSVLPMHSLVGFIIALHCVWLFQAFSERTSVSTCLVWVSICFIETFSPRKLGKEVEHLLVALSITVRNKDTLRGSNESPSTVATACFTTSSFEDTLLILVSEPFDNLLEYVVGNTIIGVKCDVLPLQLVPNLLVRGLGAWGQLVIAQCCRSYCLRKEMKVRSTKTPKRYTIATYVGGWRFETSWNIQWNNALILDIPLPTIRQRNSQQDTTCRSERRVFAGLYQFLPSAHLLFEWASITGKH